MSQKITLKLLLAGLLLLVLLPSPGTASRLQGGIDPQLAATYFAEATELARQESGRLWGTSLAGPLLFVDSATRTVAANQADAEGKLRKDGEIFTGTLPLDENIANTAFTWAGVRWTMVQWPLPETRQNRLNLLAHELFHRIQPELGFQGADPPNPHLDTEAGRTWLRLEWRALERALQERGTERRQAAADALLFRRQRQTLFPQTGKNELAQELNEGLAEFTAISASSRTSNEATARAAYALHQAPQKQSFVRSFAYASGPAYGLLLDEFQPGWRKKLKTGDDLGELLAQALALPKPAPPETEARRRTDRYDGGEVFAQEAKREKERAARAAEYKARFVDGPVLVLPIRSKFNFSFNPNELKPLEGFGMVYPTLRATDEWGILEVSDGALIRIEGGRFTGLQVSAPEAFTATPLTGKGWKLELQRGWKLASGERKGDWKVVPE